MTSNQIAFAKHKEEQRHNLAMEGENKRHNVASEGVEGIKAQAASSQAGSSWFTAKELGRHNQAQEQINWYSAANLAQLQGAQTEKTSSEVGVQKGNLSESRRHNLATERVQGGTLSESQRHNVEMESQGRSELGIKQQQADTARKAQKAESFKDYVQGFKFGVDSANGVMSLFKPKQGKK